MTQANLKVVVLTEQVAAIATPNVAYYSESSLADSRRNSTTGIVNRYRQDQSD